MHDVLEFVQFRIVDVRFALEAPDRKVREAERERVAVCRTVFGHVTVDVPGAEGLEAQQAHPVLDGSMANFAFTFVVDC